MLHRSWLAPSFCLALLLLLPLALASCADSTKNLQPREGEGEGGEGEGECEDEPCTLGEESCVGTTSSRFCILDEQTGCRRWSAATLCPDGATCAGGHCQVSCRPACELGSTSCVGNAVRTCVEPETPGECATWGEPVACQDGQTCSQGACQEGCADECSPGLRSCDGGGFKQCGEYDDDPCLDWSLVEACPAGTSCSAGQCLATCGDECAAGTVACDEGGRKSCGQYDDDGCLEWSAVIPCPEGEACSLGVCTAICGDECAAGSRRCSVDGAGTVACGQHDDDPCLDWGPVQACDEGQSCSLGECTAVCQDECAAGSARCAAAGGRETCGDYDLDPCLEWSQAAPCGEGESCSGGICAPACIHECWGAERTCSEGGVRVCGQHDADACLEWGPAQPCPAGQVCSGGSCAASCNDECATGSRTCTGGGWRACGNFDADPCLDWGEPTPCGAGESCSNGVCSAVCSDECAAGAAVCSGGGVARCGEANDGDDCLEWSRAVPCPAGQVCSRGACVTQCSDECAAGSTSCLGDAVVTCGDYDSNGCLEWGAAQPCAEGQTCSGGRCDSVCQSECVPGTSRCLGDGVQSCSSSGSQCARWGALLGGAFVTGAAIPCGEGKSCSSGLCLVVCQDECAAGEKRCGAVGSRVQQCGNWDGDACLEWSEGTPCPAGQSCSSGTCELQCSDECAAGTSQCSKDPFPATQACGNSDADPCLEWGPAARCEAGLQCRAGSCVACEAASELPGDGVDNDCDGYTDEAADGVLPEWCTLQHPPQLATTEGLSSGLVFGRVFAPGFTEAPGGHRNLLAQAGWGPPDTRPAASPDMWSWRDAGWFPTCSDCGFNDEYAVRLLVDLTGSYAVAYRFSIDGGESWLACDRAGSAPGDPYDPAKAGSLLVGPGVWWGNLQFPHVVELVVGESATFYGRVFQDGVTQPEGGSASLTVELGHGPDGVDPRDQPELWQFVPATFNQQYLNDDEYMGTLSGLPAGAYDVAFRYSLDEGQSWVYADIDGSRDGYTPAAAGCLIVRTARPTLTVGWAGDWGILFSREVNPQPTAITEPVEVGTWVRDMTDVHAIVADLWVEGHTNVDGSDPDLVVAEVIRWPVDLQGRQGEAQTLPLRFGGRHNNNHQYLWDLPAADLRGDWPLTYRFQFRFSGDAGVTWYTIGQGEGPGGGDPRTIHFREQPPE